MKKGTIIAICIIIVLIIACIIGVISYRNNSSNNTENQMNAATSGNENNEAVLNENENEASENDSTSSNGKVLVVYYSAQNHTKAVAEKIAKDLNADTFEIEPEETYSSDDLDWTNSNSRVNKEHNDESLRDVKLKTTEVPDWDSYDTVLIGYPIWWGIAAWPTNSFVKANDFTGKTVYAFCTSQSSGLGQSMELLQKDANGGNWKDGHRFSSNASDSDIQSWVDSLGL